MSLLTLVQHFCLRTNIAKPTTVYGSTDPQVLQIMAILEEEGNDLASRGDWEALTNEATHTTVATESQGAMTSIATNGFAYIKNETFWDRTETLPIGSIDGEDWAAEKGFAATMPRYRVRLRGGNLLSTPTPVAGNTWAFEYISKNWILNGATYKEYFTADDDGPLLPDKVLLAGLRWRWKKEKGFDYAEDFNSYEKLVADALGRQGIKRTVHMDEGRDRNGPGIIVNQGNWPL